MSLKEEIETARQAKEEAQARLDKTTAALAKTQQRIADTIAEYNTTAQP